MPGNAHCDVVVIGQGPAGMTAALYVARAGLSVVAFERMGPGGQMSSTEQLDNYPGFAEGVDAFDLALAMNAQAVRFGAQSVSEEVASLTLATSPKRIVCASGNTYTADAVILAMGATPRPLGIDCESELVGRGVSYCATCDGGFFRDKVVVVAGGGNTAVCDALYLSRICSHVHLVHRREVLRADAVYTRPLAELSNLTMHLNCVVDALHDEGGSLSALDVRNVATGAINTLSAKALFVAVGMQPCTAILEGTGIDLDGAGYVVAPETGQTSLPGVFVAGDVRTKTLRQVSTAVGDGANAANAAFEYLSLKS